MHQQSLLSFCEVSDTPQNISLQNPFALCQSLYFSAFSLSPSHKLQYLRAWPLAADTEQTRRLSLLGRWKQQDVSHHRAIHKSGTKQKLEVA